MNGYLFDVADEPRTGTADEALAHRGDPQTSHEAAEDLKRSGKLAAQQRAVLEALRACDGSTHAELGAFMAVHWLTPARRLPELERAGYVKKGKPRTCTIKGSRCTTWWMAACQESSQNAAAEHLGPLESTIGTEGGGSRG